MTRKFGQRGTERDMVRKGISLHYSYPSSHLGSNWVRRKKGIVHVRHCGKEGREWVWFGIGTEREGMMKGMGHGEKRES